MAGLNFSDALRNRENQYRLRGVQMPQTEVSGIAEGYSENASSSLARIKRLEIEQQRVDATKAWQEEQKRQSDLAWAEKREQRHEDEHRGKGEMWGTAIGAIVGTYAGGPAGGALLGSLGGAIGSHCIIISACTSKDSYGVEVAREFRDKYMGTYHLGGYYALAHRIVPLIDKSQFIRLIFKRLLVHRLIDYGEWILGYKPKRELKTSRIVTEGFLSLCATIGKQINIAPYIEAHR